MDNIYFIKTKMPGNALSELVVNNPFRNASNRESSLHVTLSDFSQKMWRFNKTRKIRASNQVSS